MTQPFFSYNANKGSYIADTGQIGTPIQASNAKFIRDTKGNILNHNTAIRFGTVNLQGANKLWFEYAGLFNKTTNGLILETSDQKYFIGIFNVGFNNEIDFDYVYNTAYVGFIYTQSLSLYKNQYVHIVGIYDGSKDNNNRFSIYLNGTKLNMTLFGTIPSSLDSNFSNVYISLRYISINNAKVLLAKIGLGDINQQDINNLYANFLNSKPISKPKSNFIYPKPSLLSDLGLIAAYNMKPVGNMLPNIAFDNPANNYNAAQYNGTVRKVQSVINGLKFVQKQKSDILLNNFIALQNNFTICIRYLENNGNSFLLGSTSGTAYGFMWAQYTTNTFYKLVDDTVTKIFDSSSVPSIYISNTTNMYQNVVFTCNNGIITLWINGINLGSRTFSPPFNVTFNAIGNYFNTAVYYADTTVNDIRIYNRVLMDAEIKKYHNQFASQIAIKEDFSDYSVNSNAYLTNWKIKSGTWVINELTTNNSFLKKGTKILKSTSSSSIEMPSTTAYGTWEWDFNHATIGNNKAVRIISGTKNTNYYSFGFDSSSHLNVTRTGTNIYTSSNIYNTGLYHFKITRITSGVFNIYINNIFITSFTDTTYTSSNVINCSFTTNDYIANLKITKGIIL